MMKKLIIPAIILMFLISCKGPGTGPLVKESFEETSKPHAMEPAKSPGAVTTEKINITVVPCEGCITISELLANKKSYAGKTVKITGRVTKYNPSIMGKNWVHLQDGSEFEGGYDLTVTTDTVVEVGETVTIEGKIALDKDFGYGYFYSVLLEEGKILE